MKTTFVLAYQDNLNTAHFLAKEQIDPVWRYVTDPYAALQFDTFESAKDTQSQIEINSPKYFLVVLTFESIKHTVEHPLRRMLQEAANI